MTQSTRNDGPFSRRRFLAGSLSLAAGAGVAALAGGSSAASPSSADTHAPEPGGTEAPAGTAKGGGRQPHVAVVGAGAFGGWSAYELRRRGARVTLVDSWGPGNGRASSGGETRVLRSLYGPRELFTDMALRAHDLWSEHEKRFGRRLFHRTGMLVLGADELVLGGAPLLAARGVPLRELELAEARRRFPQIDFEGVDRVFEDRETGYLLAREACRVVVEQLVAEGGEYRRANARPGTMKAGELTGLELSDGSTLRADVYLFACGSWMPKIFPGLLGQEIAPSRQEAYYFGAPAGDGRFGDDQLPVWTDRTSGGFYGIPGNRDRGFKIANHHTGEAFDPTTADRLPTASELEKARRFIARRFPALAGAPLLEAKVCHYANSTDGYFVADRHPGAGNLWLLGGGSGHGFKHGPALGEKVACWILGEEPPEPRFALGRSVEG